MRVIFLGTPEFALPSLEALCKKHEVVAVVTQPDKPRGRGARLLPPPVKVKAEELGIEVLQYPKLREAASELARLSPDIMVTAAYGQILTKEILDIPRYGVVNVHASLLPKFRGAMPVHWAVINGEAQTGVTIMQTDVGLDTGDMLLAQSIPIDKDETTGEILIKLSHLGADLLLKVMESIEKGGLNPKQQDNSQASYQPIITQEQTKINWSKSAAEIHNLVRGLNPAPIAFTTLIIDKQEVMKVRKTMPVQVEDCGGKAGEVIKSDKHGLWIKCGEGVLELVEIQMPNSKAMPARAYLNGRKIPIGTILDEGEVD